MISFCHCSSQDVVLNVASPTTTPPPTTTASHEMGAGGCFAEGKEAAVCS